MKTQVQKNKTLVYSFDVSHSEFVSHLQNLIFGNAYIKDEEFINIYDCDTCI